MEVQADGARGVAVHLAVAAVLSLTWRAPEPAITQQASPPTLRLTVLQPSQPAAVERPPVEDAVPASAAAEPEQPRVVKPVELASVDAEVPVESTRPVQRRPPRPFAGPVDSPRPTPKVGESVQRQSQPGPEAERAASVVKAAPIESAVKPTAPAADAQQRQHYLAALAASIDRRKYYPRVSRRRGEEGRVVVSFVIRKTGEITDLMVTESSGSRRLDEAALKTLRRISPFQPIPEALARDAWSITVPIAFHLNG